MIHFIDLGKQTGSEKRRFAFWNTVSDMFLDYNGSQTWATIDQLRDDLFWHLGAEQMDITLKRLSPLLPMWAKRRINH